jgi:riboflavin kinase/FMN adenylyltransferase
MEFLKYSEVKPEHCAASALTWGMFDGIHLGHQKILATLMERAREKGLPAVAMTFEPHPREVVGKTPHVPDIVPLSERVRLIQSLGVDLLILIEFTRQFADRAAQDFLDELILKIHPELMVIGYDFRFGRAREGDAEFLRDQGKAKGFELIVVPAVAVSGETVSSSRIRALIQSGDMEKAAILLGRPFSVEGQVVHGHHRGKEMGFATANLRWEAELIPPGGVYVARAEFNGKEYPAVANVGFNPTFGDEQLSIETYLLDFEGDIYKKRLRISFFKRIRDEIKFDSVDALASRIQQDITEAREWLSSNPSAPFGLGSRPKAG